MIDNKQCSPLLKVACIRVQLAAIQEGSLVSCMDGAGSWFSVVAAHLCGLLICHTCTTLPHQSHQSHQSQRGNQESNAHACDPGQLFFARLVLALSAIPFVSFCVPVYCTLFQFFLLCRSLFCVSTVSAFVSTLRTLKLFFLPASCAAIGSQTPNS